MLKLFKYLILMFSILLSESTDGTINILSYKFPYHSGTLLVQKDLMQRNARTNTGNILSGTNNNNNNNRENASFEDNQQIIARNTEHWDIRYNIPGEPGIDYPIFNTPPTTSFSCYQRHDGYYADVETRCQVFRVCSNTDLTGRGFAFLCPNGTLFNQKYFVCDWYLHVACAESENFYYKNYDYIGGNMTINLTDIMSAVQRMMYYTQQNMLNDQILQKQINSEIPLINRQNATSKFQQYQSRLPDNHSFINTHITAMNLKNVSSMIGPYFDQTKQIVKNIGLSSPAPFSNQSPIENISKINLHQQSDPVKSNNNVNVQLRSQTQFPSQTFDGFLGVQPPSRAFISYKPQQQDLLFTKTIATKTTKSNKPIGIDQNTNGIVQSKLILPFVVNSLGEVRSINQNLIDLLAYQQQSNYQPNSSNTPIWQKFNDRAHTDYGASISYLGTVKSINNKQQPQPKENDKELNAIYSGSGDLLGQTIRHNNIPANINNLSENKNLTMTIKSDMKQNQNNIIYTGSGDLLQQTVRQISNKNQLKIEPISYESNNLLRQTIDSSLNRQTYNNYNVSEILREQSIRRFQQSSFTSNMSHIDLLQNIQNSNQTLIKKTDNKNRILNYNTENGRFNQHNLSANFSTGLLRAALPGNSNLQSQFLTQTYNESNTQNRPFDHRITPINQYNEFGQVLEFNLSPVQQDIQIPKPSRKYLPIPTQSNGNKIRSVEKELKQMYTYPENSVKGNSLFTSSSSNSYPDVAASHNSYTIRQIDPLQQNIDRTDTAIYTAYIGTIATIDNLPPQNNEKIELPPIKSDYPIEIRNTIGPQSNNEFPKISQIPSRPLALPSVVHPVASTIITTQPKQQQHKEQIIVKVVPSSGWYLNDENERKSYFEAVAHGLLNENGDIFVNNVQRTFHNNKNYNPNIIVQRKDLNGNENQGNRDDEENYFKGPSSYQLPLLSVGKLPCDSDSINFNGQSEDDNGYQYIPPCSLNGTLDFS